MSAQAPAALFLPAELAGERRLADRAAATRSRPRVLRARLEIAGTLQPSPIRNGSATAPCRPMRWNARSTANAMRAITPECSSATSSSISGIM